MTTASRWLPARLFFILVLALVCVGIAGAASAQGVFCITLDHGGVSPSLPLLRLVPTFQGNGFVAIVGRKIAPGAGDRGIVSGGGATINGVFEMSLQGSGIVTPSQPGATPVLISGTTHILLNPVTLIGSFKAVETETPASGAAVFNHVEGIASIVTCPPGS